MNETIKYKVELIASALTKSLSGNTTQHISPDRVLPTAIIAAHIFSETELNQAKAFGIPTLWLFGIDRFYDEMEFSLTELDQLIERVLSGIVSDQKVTGQIGEVADQISYGQELFNFLASLGPSPAIMASIHAKLRNTLYDGMRYTFQLRTHQIAKPELSEYLSHAEESIGVKFVNLCALASMTTTLSFEDTSFLDEIQQLSAQTIRLANDVVTTPKERSENNLNYVLLHPNEKVGRAATQQLITEKVTALEKAIKKTPAYLKRFSQYVYDLTTTTLRFYDVSDFYDSAASLNDKHL